MPLSLRICPSALEHSSPNPDHLLLRLTDGSGPRKCFTIVLCFTLTYHESLWVLPLPRSDTVQGGYKEYKHLGKKKDKLNNLWNLSFHVAGMHLAFCVSFSRNAESFSSFCAPMRVSRAIRKCNSNPKSCLRVAEEYLTILNNSY